MNTLIPTPHVRVNYSIAIVKITLLMRQAKICPYPPCHSGVGRNPVFLASRAYGRIVFSEDVDLLDAERSYSIAYFLKKTFKCYTYKSAIVSFKITESYGLKESNEIVPDANSRYFRSLLYLLPCVIHNRVPRAVITIIVNSRDIPVYVVCVIKDTIYRVVAINILFLFRH